MNYLTRQFENSVWDEWLKVDWWAGWSPAVGRGRPAVWNWHPFHGPLARYAKSQVAHAPGMPGTFYSSPRVSDPDMHHGTCVTHLPWCMQVSLTSCSLWNRWRGKRSRCSRCISNPQFYASSKRPMGQLASNWYLPCWQYTETCIHFSQAKCFIRAKCI